MILDIYALDDNDQDIDVGIRLALLVVFLTIFYQLILPTAGPEL